jgi:hypothetical protein
MGFGNGEEGEKYRNWGLGNGGEREARAQD